MVCLHFHSWVLLLIRSIIAGATLGNFFQIRLFWKHLMIGMSVRVSIRSADVSEMEELNLIEED